MHNFKVNQSPLDVCKVIVANHPEITSVRLIAHTVGINWRQKYPSNSEKLSHLNTSFEHPKPIKTKTYLRDAFLQLELLDLGKIVGHEVWSMTSLVSCTDGESRHIPMMNFHPIDASLGDIKKTLAHICRNYRGAILDSGRYFHYYGDVLLSQEEWLKFMADFLMPCIIVSPRYIGHRLYDGYCTLRLTTEQTYKVKVPRVIELV